MFMLLQVNFYLCLVYFDWDVFFLCFSIPFLWRNKQFSLFESFPNCVVVSLSGCFIIWSKMLQQMCFLVVATTSWLLPLDSVGVYRMLGFYNVIFHHHATSKLFSRFAEGNELIHYHCTPHKLLISTSTRNEVIPLKIWAHDAPPHLELVDYANQTLGVNCLPFHITLITFWAQLVDPCNSSLWDGWIFLVSWFFW